MLESGEGGLKIARQAWALAVKLRKLEAIYCTAKTSNSLGLLLTLSPPPPHNYTYGSNSPKLEFTLIYALNRAAEMTDIKSAI